MKSETDKLLEARKHFKVCPICGGSGVLTKKPFEHYCCNSCTKDYCEGSTCSILRDSCFKCDGTGIIINS